MNASEIKTTWARAARGTRVVREPMCKLKIDQTVVTNLAGGDDGRGGGGGVQGNASK